jgi:hypothetical protein
MDALRSWVEERLAPVVLVAGTPAAEAMVANANGLSLVDLLRPQARVGGISGAAPPALDNSRLQRARGSCAYAAQTLRPAAARPPAR